MNRDAALQKILKCLRLSRSANEHEAAAALRQAQKLMAAHGISGNDVIAAEVGDASAKSGATSRPARWEAALARLCADAFGCDLIFVSSHTSGAWQFVGCGGRELLCQYAFVVLLRQCRRARTEYSKTKLRRCKPRARTARADVFCVGWVYAVRSTVEAFAWSDADRAAVRAWRSSKGLANLGQLQPVARKPRGDGYADAIQGHRAADGVRLDRPVAGRNQDAIAG